MSKYDDIKAKFAEVWEKLSSLEKQKLLNNVKAKFSKFMCRYKELSAQEKQKLSERLKDWISDIKYDFYLDKRGFIAMIFAYICFGVGIGAMADAGVTMYNYVHHGEPLMEEVRSSSDFKAYESGVVVLLRKKLNAGDIDSDEYMEIGSGLSDRDGILDYIANSDNDDWKERSKKLLTEEEYSNRLAIDGKIILVGFGAAVSSGPVCRAIDEVDDYLKAKKPKREDEDSWSS